MLESPLLKRLGLFVLARLSDYDDNSIFTSVMYHE
jgi:hypothetical protein